MKQLQSIELFSGAGGLALGLHAAGLSHRAFYEWNAAAVEPLLYYVSEVKHFLVTDLNHYSLSKS